MSDYQAVERLLEVRRFREAEEYLSRELAQNPNDPAGHYYLARLAYDQGDMPSAKVHVQECLAQDPFDRDGQHLLVLVQRMLGEDVECEATLLELLRAAPDDPNALARYARLLLNNLYLDEARQLVNEALRHDPHNREACIVLVLFALIDGDKDMLAESLSLLVTHHSQSMYALAAIFDALVDRGRFFEAEDLARQMVRMRPDKDTMIPALIAVRLRTHPLALPAYPLYRFGWPLAAVVGLATIALAVVPGGSPIPLLLFKVWSLYTWLHARPLRAWIQWRGV